MSAEGQIYVEKFSPYSGATFQVHLRLGLLSNDANDYRIFSGDVYLAEKCRCGVRTVKRAKAQLIRDGFLELLKPAAGRRVAEYRFIFKGQRIGGQIGLPSEMGGHRRSNRGPTASSSPTYRNELKEDESTSNSEPVDMAEVRRRNDEILGRRRAQ